jgi:glycosyltransferase involved in cell wall biosynthesis
MQLVLSLSPGGTERLVIEIVRGLAARVDSVVCCLDEPGAWATELGALNVPVIPLQRQPGFHPSLAGRLARLMKAHRIDIVHCHHYSPYVYGLLASMLRPGVRLVFTEHGKLSDHGPSRKRRLVNPLLSRWPARVCAVSADLKQHMVSEGFPPHRIDVLYNGIDPGLRPTRADKRAARAALGIPDDAFLIGTAGRLDPVKNLNIFIEAHAIVAARNPLVRAAIIGDGPERRRLEAKAAQIGAVNPVVFTGYRQDVRALMAAFDVYVNCSVYEGVSLTILEAMAAGLPVIASPAGGNPEVVIEPETGLLIPARARSIAEGLHALLHDPRRRRVMGDAGRWRVIRHFSIARMVDDYARAYLRPGRSAPVEPANVEAATPLIPANASTPSGQDFVARA